jgi:hypothetical protein
MPGRGRHGKPRPGARRPWLAAGAGLALTAAGAVALAAGPAPGGAGGGTAAGTAASRAAALGGVSLGAAGTGTAPAGGTGTSARGAGSAGPDGGPAHAAAAGRPGAGRPGGDQPGGVPSGHGRPGRRPSRPGLTGTGRAAAPGAALTFCAVPATPAVRAALDRVVPGTSQAEIEPLGVTGDGRAAYVSAWTPGFSGVAELNLASGALRPIRPFADPVTDQADGTASGHWLVWAQTYSLSSLDRFTIYAWNAVTGRLLRLGQSVAGPHGVPWPSPWHAPAVSGDYAAWAQGYGPGGLVEIRLANLVTGQVSTIRRGHVQPPLFDGGLVVWPESDAPGTQTTLRAYRLAAGRLAALPAALAAVHGTEFVVTDGTRTAYLDPSLTRLYYSAHPDQPARLGLALPAGTDFGSLALAPGTLAWTTSRATYLASTRTGAVMPVTPQYGYATGSGSVVLVSDAPAAKAVRPPLPLHVISPAALTWPACPAR